MDIVRTENLCKFFGPVKAVNILNLKIEKGEIYGLLGPNGSGKTTTIKLLVGLLKPTSGKGYVFEKDSMSRSFLHDIGYMPQEIALYPDLTVHDNLMIFGKIFGLSNSQLKRNESKLMEFIDLQEKIDTPISDLSGGMRHRVSLICSMIHKPKLLFLDEPTVGVDPELRMSFWNNFRRLGELGTTIIITTHYMDEAQRCTKIGLMRAGTLIAEGPPQDILKSTQTKSLEDAFLYLTSREMVQ